MIQTSIDIERAIKRIASDSANMDVLCPDPQQQADAVMSSLKERSYNFGDYSKIVLRKNGKNRIVVKYDDPYSVENVLCNCIKQIVDRTVKVKYPNRNKTMRALFSMLSAVRQMSDFTIVRFDFKNFFNSLSARYIFEEFLKSKLSSRLAIDLIRDFANQTEYTYAGLCSSNALAEIAASSFDQELKATLSEYGLIFYERYVDDSIVIFNRHVEETQIKDMLLSVIESVFHNPHTECKVKCKTEYNEKKFTHITRRTIGSNASSVDYLGYEFLLSQNNNKITIKYGITDEKIAKYNLRIDKIIEEYTSSTSADYGNLELLRHRILAFTSRTVYQSKRFRKIDWKVKGFISNYGELRYLLDQGLIDQKAESFLKNMVLDAISRAGIPRPYFIPPQNTSSCYRGYNLYANMKSNKTLVLVERIGYDYKSLIALCQKAGINFKDSNGKRRGYSTLVRDYLIKVRVGY